MITIFLAVVASLVTLWFIPSTFWAAILVTITAAFAFLYDIRSPKYQLTLLVVGVGAIWLFRNFDYTSMVVATLFMGYALALNGRGHDYIGVFLIVIVFKLVELPLAGYFFAQKAFVYLQFLGYADSALALALLFYKSKLVRWAADVKTPPRQIKQVHLLQVIYLVMVIHAVVVYLSVWWFKHGQGGLGLYNSFPTVRSALKALEYYALWAIFIDSVNIKTIHYRALVSRLRGHASRKG